MNTNKIALNDAESREAFRILQRNCLDEKTIKADIFRGHKLLEIREHFTRSNFTNNVTHRIITFIKKRDIIGRQKVS